MLSHLIPAIRSSIGIFRILDILIGQYMILTIRKLTDSRPPAIASLSFLPLLLYTLYLFLLASGTLIPNLPQRYQPIIRCLIIIFIPMIVLFNEVGSFVGISRRKSLPTLSLCEPLTLLLLSRDITGLYPSYRFHNPKGPNPLDILLIFHPRPPNSLPGYHVLSRILPALTGVHRPAAHRDVTK